MTSFWDYLWKSEPQVYENKDSPSTEEAVLVSATEEETKVVEEVIPVVTEEETKVVVEEETKVIPEEKETSEDKYVSRRHSLCDNLFFENFSNEDESNLSLSESNEYKLILGDDDYYYEDDETFGNMVFYFERSRILERHLAEKIKTINLLRFLKLGETKKFVFNAQESSFSCPEIQLEVGKKFKYYGNKNKNRKIKNSNTQTQN
jgi:hypothetical protein